MDGTLNGTTKATVGANGLSVDVQASVLPSGAATAAKQPALGTAGTASSDVISVQGIASMTPVQVSQATASNFNATVVNAGTFAVQDAAAEASLSVLDDWDETDRAKVNPIVGNAGVTGNTGTVDAGTQRVTLATNVALPTGSNAIGKLAANSGVDIGDVDITSIAAGTNNIGQVSVAPQTANGLSVFNATSSDGATALTSTAQAIKASAGQLYGWYIYNPNSSAQFVQLYNTAAASVTVGTTNPLFMLTIPATSAANVEFTNGITFSNAGWSCAATATAGGSGAPSTALDAVFFYK